MILATLLRIREKTSLTMNQTLTMNQKRLITDADLLDFFEGRMAAPRRAAVALALAENPWLARRGAELRERVSGLRLLRPTLMGDCLPDDWLMLAAQIAAR